MTPARISFPSLSSFENASPLQRGSNPTPHPAKLTKKGNDTRFEQPARHHSSPNFGSDLAEGDAFSQPASNALVPLERAHESPEKQRAEMQDAENGVEQFTVALRALAERVQKVNSTLPHSHSHSHSH
jgi:hypothetical protein